MHDAAPQRTPLTAPTAYCPTEVRSPELDEIDDQLRVQDDAFRAATAGFGGRAVVASSAIVEELAALDDLVSDVGRTTTTSAHLGLVRC